MKIYNDIYRKQLHNKRIQILKYTIIWILKILIVLFLSFVTVYFFGMKVKVSGNSMEPTVSNGHFVLINRLENIILPPKSGTLIAFKPSGNPLSNIEIKRIVATPGDKVKIKDGFLYVNNKKSFDNFSKINDAGTAKDEITLDSDEYFVLSDNREIMQDSRNPDISMVKRSYMIGSAWFIIEPASDRGFIR